MKNLIYAYTLYFYFLKILIIANFFFTFLEIIYCKFFNYKRILIIKEIQKKWGTVWNYKSYSQETYFFFDFFFDFFFFFKNFFFLIKNPYKIFFYFIILIFLIIFYPIYIFIRFFFCFFYFSIIFISIIFNFNTIIIIKNIDFNFNWKNFFFLSILNMKVSSLEFIISLLTFKKKKITASDLKQILVNYFFLFLFSKPLWVLKLYFLTVNLIFIEGTEEFLKNIPKKNKKVKFKIYVKLIRRRFFWLGHQLFFNSYFKTDSIRNLLVKDRKIYFY